MEFGRPLAIIVYYTVQFDYECCKSSVPDMGPNTILKIKKISRDVLKVNFFSNIQSSFLKEYFF